MEKIIKLTSRILLIVILLFTIFLMIPMIKKGLGFSFVNTHDKQFNEIIYKGQPLISINKGCVIIHFKGVDFPTDNNYKCAVEISEDFEFIRFKNDSSIIIWENGKEKIKE
jgi:hypothetical protein